MCIKLNMSDKWKILIGTVFKKKKKKHKKPNSIQREKSHKFPYLKLHSQGNLNA